MLSKRRTETYKKIVEILGEASSCNRARVGCLILKEGRIISTGYNGSLPGAPECDSEGHLMVDGHCIRTIHAEQNALMFLAKQGISSSGCVAFVTHLPCPSCTKLLIQAGIEDVYYINDYKISENPFLKDLRLWKI